MSLKIGGLVLFSTKNFEGILGLGPDLIHLLKLLCRGFLDSIRFDIILNVLATKSSNSSADGANTETNDQKVKRILISCFVLNLVYVLIISLVDNLVMPIFSELFDTYSRNATFFVFCWNYFMFGFMKLYFLAFWVVAMLIVAFWRSNIWYGELAAALPPPIAIRGTPINKAKQDRSIVSEFSDLIVYIFCVFVFKALNSIIAFIPYTGWWLSAVLQCLLASFYAFESHWANTHPQHSRQQFMIFIERDWAYYLGFGIPMTAATIFLDFATSFALYNGLLPIFIILAGQPRAFAWRPPSSRHNFSVLPHSIRYFALVQKIVDWALVQITKIQKAKLFADRDRKLK